MEFCHHQVSHLMHTGLVDSQARSLLNMLTNYGLVGGARQRHTVVVVCV